MKKIIKIISGCTLALILCLFVTGCENEPSNKEQLELIKNRILEIDNYLAEVTITYSDETQNINGTFIDYIDTSKEDDVFTGMINYNGEIFETSGKRYHDSYVIQDMSGRGVFFETKLPRLRDMSITNLKKIINRAGEERLEYYSAVINEKYKARLGVGSDNMIYTISIDLKDTIKEDKVIGVYKIDVEFRDEYRKIDDVSISKIKEGKSFFDLFITTDDYVEEVQ